MGKATPEPLAPANEARPRIRDAIEARSTGSVTRGRVIEVTRFRDITLIDRMSTAGQFSDRQTRAARNIMRIWTAAGLNPKVTAALPYIHAEKPEKFEDEAHAHDDDPLEKDETYRDRYRALLRSLPGHASTLIDGLMMDVHPGIRWLATLQATLSRLADEWGYEKT